MGFFSTFAKIVSTGLLLAGSIVGGPVGLGLIAGGLIIGGIASQSIPSELEKRKLNIRSRWDTNAPHPVVYGKAKVGSIIHDLIVDDSQSALGDILWMPTTLCHGSRHGYGIADIYQIYLDDNLAVDSDGERQEPYSYYSLQWAELLGTDTQSFAGETLTWFTYSNSLAALTGYGAWNNNDDGAGLAGILFGFINKPIEQGDGSAKLTYSRGVPQVACVVKGNYIEDTRDEVASTVTITITASNNRITRGSGSFTSDSWTVGDHIEIVDSSSNDGVYTIDTVQSTYVEVETTLVLEGPKTGITLKRWSHPDNTGGTNPAMCIRDYLLSDVYGPGFDATWIDDTSFEAMADYCDEDPVSGKSGDTVRFTCNGWLDTSRTISDNLAELLSSCRGNLVWEGGQFRLNIRRGSMTPNADVELTVDNIIGELSIANAGVKETYNIGRATFVNPFEDEELHKPWQTQWPPTSASNTYLTADNNQLNILEINLPFTNSQHMAQRIIATILRESRLGITVQLTATEEALQLSVGDVVYLTHETPNWDQETFWVEQMSLLPDGSVGLALRHYDTDAYTVGSLDDADLAPDTGWDVPWSVAAPTDVTITSGIANDRFVVSWNASTSPHLDFYEVQAKHNTTTGGDGIYRTFGRVRANEAIRQAWVTGVRNGQSWTARVRAVNIYDRTSAWATSPATTIETHCNAEPTFNAPVINYDSIEYDVSFDSCTDYCEVYTRENTAASGLDPYENMQYYAGRYESDGEQRFIVGCDHGNFLRTKLVAYNAWQERGADSGILEHQATVTGTAPTGPPTSATATTVGVTNVALKWTAGDASASTYLYIGGVFKIEKAAGVSNATVTGLESDTQYVFGLRHKRGGQFNPVTSTAAVEVTVTTSMGQLGVPQNFAASTVNPYRVRMTWTEGTNCDENTSYALERAVSVTATYTSLATVGPGVLGYTHVSEADASAVYYFRGKATRPKWSDSSYTAAVTCSYGFGPRVTDANLLMTGVSCTATGACLPISECTSLGRRRLIRWSHLGCDDDLHHICIHESTNGQAFVERYDDLSCDEDPECVPDAKNNYSGGFADFDGYCGTTTATTTYAYRVRIETDGGDVSIDSMDTATKRPIGTTVCAQ